MTSPRVVVVLAADEIVDLDLETLLHMYRPTVLRNSLRAEGLPYHEQPLYARECLKLLVDIQKARRDQLGD